MNQHSVLFFGGIFDKRVVAVDIDEKQYVVCETTKIPNSTRWNKWTNVYNLQVIEHEGKNYMIGVRDDRKKPSNEEIKDFMINNSMNIMLRPLRKDTVSA